MTTSILLVDDDPTVLHCWERQLDDLGYEVVAAHGSAEATLQWADSGGRADLGLIDIGLPGLSGIDLIRSLRRCIPELQLLVLTVFDDTPTVLSAFRAGARGYLLKGWARHPRFWKRLPVVALDHTRWSTEHHSE